MSDQALSSTGSAPAEIFYILQPTRTAGGTGFFAPQPQGDPDFQTALRQMRRTPLDSFWHQYLLRLLGAFAHEARAALAREAAAGDMVVQALLTEAEYLLEAPDLQAPEAPAVDDSALIAATPLILLRHRRLADRRQHWYWVEKLAANILEHRPLALPGDDGRPPLPKLSAEKTSAGEPVSIARILPTPNIPADTGSTLTDVIQTAHERLAGCDILVSSELRHEASLSPVALMRQWRLERRVKNGALAYRLGGFMTAYGRGLTLDAARASCLMEIVERYSAFGHFCQDAVAGHSLPVALIRARPGEMRQAGRRVLNPEALDLEAPWHDAPLHWRPARIVAPEGRAEIWVPAQSVYLFCNLDEPDLFSALGSTGLAAGSTMAEACLAALLEILERDAAATTLFKAADCFTVAAEDPCLNKLLAHYQRLGIRVQFQDLTGALGVPCYKCFVTDAEGRIAKGTGAHLDGKRALLAALTETMYPYPNGPASGPGLKDLPVRFFSALPNFSSRCPASDLARLEDLLTVNGLFPIYADLTRADLGLPVVRAIIPGLTVMADFDRFSRLTPRLAAVLSSALRRSPQGARRGLDSDNASG